LQIRAFFEEARCDGRCANVGRRGGDAVSAHDDRVGATDGLRKAVAASRVLINPISSKAAMPDANAPPWLWTMENG
jgi:hypothetical protein